ncbi:MAG: Hpt domain-containing protein [Cellulophaga sp.]|nr:Hpt domain-containing protein [Cellulophaga sp.]
MEQTPNLNYIKELSGGDTEFEKKFINVLKEEIPLEKEAFINYTTHLKYKDTADLVHKIKHKLSILGLTEDYKLAVNFEEALNRNDDALKDTFLTILHKIDTYCKTL